MCYLSAAQNLKKLNVDIQPKQRVTLHALYKLGRSRKDLHPPHRGNLCCLEEEWVKLTSDSNTSIIICPSSEEGVGPIRHFFRGGVFNSRHVSKKKLHVYIYIYPNILWH